MGGVVSARASACLTYDLAEPVLSLMARLSIYLFNHIRITET